MVSLVKTVSRTFDRILNSFAFLSICLILFLMVAILYEISMRYFIGRAELWTFEVTQYTLLFITFLSTAWLLKEEGHVKMDLVIITLKPRYQVYMNAVTSFIGALMFLILTFYSAKVVLQVVQTGYYLPTVMEIPAAPIFVVIPVGSLLLAIQFIRRGRNFLASLKSLKAGAGPVEGRN